MAGAVPSLRRRSCSPRSCCRRSCSPVGGLIVVFVATLWTRNPNQQGWQDQFAKTLVLTDVEE